MNDPGQIVILNGAPRSGKSSIAAVIQDTFPGVWMNLGVDAWMAVTPPNLRPGIGLRPGGERKDLEEWVPVLYAGLYESIAAHARLGLDVVVDVDHHDAYLRPRGILRDCARRLAGLPVLFVGVRCPLDVIWSRREETWHQSRDDEEVSAAVARWQRVVHEHGGYDLEVDTSASTAEECAERILERLRTGPPGLALDELANPDRP